MLTVAITVRRMRSRSVMTGVKVSVTPNGTKETPCRPTAVAPVTTGTANSPPEKNVAGWPFSVVSVGSASVAGHVHRPQRFDLQVDAAVVEHSRQVAAR